MVRIQHALALLLTAAACAPSAIPATITVLGTLGGTSSYATAINDAGQVAGYSTNAAGVDLAFLYSGGVLNNLGTFGGNSSMAYGINNSGQVVGTVESSLGPEAFLYSGGAGTIIGTVSGGLTLNPSPYGPLTAAYGINSSGEIAAVGIYYVFMAGFEVTTGYLYSGGNSTYLPGGGVCTALRTGTPMPCNAVVSAISDNGQIVGTVPSGEGVDQATLYSGGTMTTVVPNIFGSGANDINDAGQIVGYYTVVQGTQFGAEPAGQDGFLFSDTTGQLTDLGPGDALGINAQGQVVGYTQTGTADNAFLYSGGMLIDLNSLLPANSGWNLIQATALNDSGQIVGYGTFDGETQAFLLDTATAPAPEPASLALLGTGGALILLMRKRGFRNYRGGARVDDGAGFPSTVSGSISSTRDPSGS